MEINMRNDALKHQGRYQGVYERSEIVNGKPSWNNSVHAIWYTRYPRDEWVVGNLTDLGQDPIGPVGHDNSYKYSMYASGLGYRFNLHRLTDNVWKYWNGSKWNTPVFSTEIVVSCKGT